MPPEDNLFSVGVVIRGLDPHRFWDDEPQTHPVAEHPGGVEDE
jgi:hypothetical protein